ncbi:MAG: hypothetical protein J6K85_01945 [Clostridia bacterium]|nr:hypothetical protein [Clostridia bacterium]
MTETNDYNENEPLNESEEIETVEPDVSEPDGSIDIESDLSELASEFPEAISEEMLTGRYSELRALGLTPAEAYLASVRRTPKFDSRSHLKASVPRAVKSPGGAMSRRELLEARELFSGLSDRQIEDLYRKVTK